MARKTDDELSHGPLIIDYSSTRKILDEMASLYLRSEWYEKLPLRIRRLSPIIDEAFHLFQLHEAEVGFFFEKPLNFKKGGYDDQAYKLLNDHPEIPKEQVVGAQNAHTYRLRETLTALNVMTL